MALSPELLAAYKEAHYTLTYPEILIRIGEWNRALDELVGESGTAAYVTAANPRSEPRSDEENQFLLAALREYVDAAGHVFLEGEARDPKGQWVEPSLLILGISRAEAIKLARAFEQNAIVFCEQHKPPELVVVAKLRLVLDTQVWLDWLVFDDPSIAPLKKALLDDRADIYIDPPCDAELERVLGYPVGKKAPEEWLRLARLAEARRIARQCVAKLGEKERAALPRCSDPDDQKLLELAAAAKADMLVTRDAALLQLAPRVPFRILRPTAFGELS